MNTKEQENFNNLVYVFLLSFENVFDIDWEHTKSMITEDTEGMYIAETGSFIRPMCGNESNNWHNRGSLLSAYRSLVKEGERLGILKSDLR